MKKLLVILLAIVLVLPMLAGCQKSGKGNASKDDSEFIESLKTVGDLIALDTTGSSQWGLGDGKYIRVFNYKGTIYRAICESTQEIEDKVAALDYMDEKHDEKLEQIVSPIKITKIENLSVLILKQEELDKLVGKTGEDLLNDGWYCNGSNLDNMEFFMIKNPFSYIVTFEGKLEDTDDFDEEEAIKPLKIKSIVYDGLGDATEIDEPEN